MGGCVGGWVWVGVSNRGVVSVCCAHVVVRRHWGEDETTHDSTL